MYEASMNFDLANVEMFLLRLNTVLELDLPVIGLMEMTRQTAIETEQYRTIRFIFNGSQTVLVYKVFMDDIDAPDLYFFTPSGELAESIQQEMVSYSQELGI